MRLASMTQYGEAAANTRRLIVDRKEFEILNLSGSRPHVANRESRMPWAWRRDYEESMFHGEILYEVRSWQTPIAWYVEDEGWVMPAIGYTAYTSRHQGLVSQALTDAGYSPRTTIRRELLPFRIDWPWEAAS